MTARTHIGKIVIDYENVEHDLLEPLLQPDNKRVEKKNYNLDGIQDTLLITGQTGLAAQCLQYIINHSDHLNDIIVVSYSKPKYEIQLLMNDCIRRKKGGSRGDNKASALVNIHLLQCDVGNYQQLYECVTKLYSSNTSIKPVKFVILTANVYSSKLADDIDHEEHHKVMSAKAIGALNLHELFIQLGWQLTHFNMFSSISTMLKGVNTTYGVSNTVLDLLAKYRSNNLGMQATSIAWGSVGSAGYLSYEKGASVNLTSIGAELLPTAPSKKFNFIKIYDGDFERILGHVPRQEHRFQHLVKQIKNQTKTTTSSSTTNDIVIDYISEVVSISRDGLSLDTKLKDYGVDSMIAIQIKSWVDREFNKQNLFNQSQISNGTINEILQTLNT
ncbi:fatty acid synthase [Cavenderia fasciculata]|uniref:Fatty acid synthase n=1 Tax=Cavenderia fasciculata TaxID=261658 RepID=F4PV21_CACFS|nr:fatty acid synthase [Cavenderia fasciculata]EGG21137.1 fatty acid synthase [Cavenderia fasciculata]|eukprot:XP_004358987.1 fatty acid synthase [Cavenderia fasciculata]